MSGDTDDVVLLERELETARAEIEDLRRANQNRRAEFILVGRDRWVPLVIALVLAFAAGFGGVALFGPDQTYTRVICRY